MKRNKRNFERFKSRADKEGGNEMSEKTHAEIVAEIRFHGQQNIDAEKDKPEYGILTVEGRIAINYADELEAAHKRELDVVTVLATKYRTALARINALATYCRQPNVREQIIEQCENIFAEERNSKTEEARKNESKK